MQDLKILQQQFKKAITNAGDDASTLPIRENGLSKKLRLSVYQDAFYLRLRDCVMEDFPKTFEKIGDEENLMKNFLAEVPSTFANPAEYSEKFVEYLAKHRPDLRELAQVEWEKCLSLYAVNAAPIDATQLAKFSPEELLTTRFTLHASLRIAPTGDQFCLIYRYNGDVHEQIVTKEKQEIIAKLLQNKSIEEIIELYPEQSQDETLIFEIFSFLAAKGLIIGRK